MLGLTPLALATRRRGRPRGRPPPEAAGTGGPRRWQETIRWPTPRPDASQEFEKVLKDSATEVASFERHDRPLIERVQHLLHSNPALVPLIVLVLSVAALRRSLARRASSSRAFSLTLILQQVAITGIVGAAQTLVVLTAGIDLSVGAIMVLSSVVMGQFTFRYGIPVPISILCGFAVGGALGYINGFLVARGEAAAVHRHARHVADRAGGELPLLGATRRSAARTSRRRRRSCSSSAPDQASAARCFTSACIVMVAAGARAQLRAQPHRLGPARLCDRRRSRRGRARRRAGQQDADLGLHASRA